MINRPGTSELFLPLGQVTHLGQRGVAAPQSLLDQFESIGQRGVAAHQSPGPYFLDQVESNGQRGVTIIYIVNNYNAGTQGIPGLTAKVEEAKSLPILTTYIKSTLEKAVLKQLEDGSYFGQIPDCPGVWANEQDLEYCRQVLQEVFEEWLLLKLKDNDPLPVIGEVNLNEVVEEVWDQ